MVVCPLGGIGVPASGGGFESIIAVDPEIVVRFVGGAVGVPVAGLSELGVHVEVTQAGVVACDAGVLYLSGAVKQLIGFVVDDDAIEFLSVAVFQGGLVGVGAVGGDGAVDDVIVAFVNRTALVGVVGGDEAVGYFAGGLTYAAAGLGVISGDDAIVDISGAVVDAAAGLGVVFGDGAIEDFAVAVVDGAAVIGVIIGEGGVGDVAGAAGDSAAVRCVVAGEGASV